MAKMNVTLPDAVIKDMQKISNNTQKIFGAMTRAGAEVAYGNVMANMPLAVKQSEMLSCLKLTKTYKTPSDGGINNKVGFYGYFTNKDGRVVPAPLVANLYEYGRSDSDFPISPFFRKAFNRYQIEKAMLEAQKSASGGLLE